MTVEVIKDTRTIRFNNYYHGACGYVAKALARRGCEGWTNDDVHELSKRECNPVKRMLIDGNGEIVDRTIGGSTREMTSDEFLSYKDRFMQYWAEQGIAVPDEYWKDEV